jgi:cell division septum initiation protein DivIVA
MGSLIDELQRREAAARAEAEELRGQIAELTEHLAGVEERLSRLVIARETVDEVLSEGAEASPAMPERAAPSRFGHLSPIGGRPVRAAQIAAAAGLSTDKSKVEGLRSKLKRLAERGWLAEEAGPGLFALARNGTGELSSNPG